MKGRSNPESREGPVPTSSRGFLKVSGDEAQSITPSQRVALIRRGNEFFNKGDYATAKRIFMTVGYSDGLIRLGNRFSKEGNPLEAFRMFWLAGDTRRVAELSENMAQVIRKWLREDEPLPHREKRE
ncbi:hypothetical protein AU468_04825 [Alkalispirochaeta sphaeroplastigenens]|uniref:Uncharacterized protein n=1 Tax=Alkalispirochaeta sphaeroplastigenens TaxID=1187066 RepID=A0A2S4JWU2_9SPIO|nr:MULTISPECIES: hypothetical protein [Alkalispirochaeta]POR03992.1 hypothetical protein AU468_04825 [Alkalispirochaeta sphaeroplastigenens]